LFKFSGGVAARRQHDDLAGVGRRRLGGGVNPRLQVFDAIDDAATELRVEGACTVDAVLLKREASGVRR